MKNFEVDNFLKELNHPQIDEIEQIREIILKTDTEITEIIKWNAPSYVYNGQDRITFHFPPKRDKFLLVFHTGAKVKARSTANIIRDESGLLEWKSDDRAIMTFKDNKFLEDNKTYIKTLVHEWIRSA